MKNTQVQLYNELKKYGDTYFEEATQGAEYPYIVYRFDVPITNFQTQTGDFVINVWSDNLGECVDLSDAIWKGLDRFVYSDSNCSLYVRQSFMQSVPDEQGIKRKQLNFTVLFEED